MHVDGVELQVRILNKQNDYEVYKEVAQQCFDTKYWIPADSANHFKAKDNIYFIAYLDDVAVGACNIMFLEADMFTKLRSGEVVNDMTIGLDDIMYAQGASILNIYVTATVVLETYRRKGIAQHIREYIERYVAKNYPQAKTQWLSLCINDASYNLNKQLGLHVRMVNTVGDTVMFK